jgi:hypothetical protein
MGPRRPWIAALSTALCLHSSQAVAGGQSHASISQQVFKNMSMKKTDLDRLAGLKLDSQMRGAAVPGRFGQGAAQLPDRKEQRRLDSAAGLVPFACKLPADVAKTLRERADAHAGGINGLMAELLQKALA